MKNDGVNRNSGRSNGWHFPALPEKPLPASKQRALVSRLTAFMRKNSLNKAEAARLLWLDRSTVSRWVGSRDRLPRRLSEQRKIVMLVRQQPPFRRVRG